MGNALCKERKRGTEDKPNNMWFESMPQFNPFSRSINWYDPGQNLAMNTSSSKQNDASSLPAGYDKFDLQGVTQNHKSHYQPSAATSVFS